jgi:hypothetical protein
MPQLTFDMKVFNVSTLKASGQSQCQMLTLETEQGLIQVPIDVQAASKVAGEKRKRYAIASRRFRQRRKEKEQETLKLEAQVREMIEERDFRQDVLLQNGIPISSHASLAGPQFQDTETRQIDRLSQHLAALHSFFKAMRTTLKVLTEHVNRQWELKRLPLKSV